MVKQQARIRGSRLDQIRIVHRKEGAIDRISVRDMVERTPSVVCRQSDLQRRPHYTQIHNWGAIVETNGSRPYNSPAYEEYRINPMSAG